MPGTASNEGPLSLAGITAFEITVYEVPEKGADLDFTRTPLRGWEPAVEFRDGPKSGFGRWSA